MELFKQKGVIRCVTVLLKSVFMGGVRGGQEDSVSSSRYSHLSSVDIFVVKTE